MFAKFILLIIIVSRRKDHQREYPGQDRNQALGQDRNQDPGQLIPGQSTTVYPQVEVQEAWTLLPEIPKTGMTVV